MYSPDERRNIRAEMNRDAAPSAEEAKQMHFDWLRNNGCKYCDENDPEKLNRTGHPMPSCSAMQKPRGDPFPICDDCADEKPSYRAQQIERARGCCDAIAFYECDRPVKLDYERPMMEVEEQVGWDDNDDPLMETTEVPQPHTFANADVSVKCRCGAVLDEVIEFDEDDVDGGDA